MRSLLGNRTLALGLLLVSGVVLACLVSFVWTPYDPTLVIPGDRWLPPSGRHWFGTDGFGRDLFSQVLVGARSTLAVVLGATALAAVAGTFLAVATVVPPSPVAEPLAHLVDVVIALPTLLLALVLAAVFGGSSAVAVAAIAVGESVILARVLRPEIARALVQDYVLAARAGGASTWWIVRRHLLPTIKATLTVQVSLALSLAVLVEAALSYLGLGTPPPTPSWGRLVEELQVSVRTHPGAMVFPGLAIVATTLGFNLLGDGLREISDPRLRTGSASGPASGSAHPTAGEEVW